MYYPDWYNRISAPFRDEFASQVIIILDRALVVVMAALYIVEIALLVFTGDFLRMLRVVIVPALVFALVTYLRTRIGAPRPYEIYDINPIIFKDSFGDSLPSRHVASAVIIAFALSWVHLDWGVIGFVVSAFLAFTRIVGGVHFPKDIAASIGIGVVFGLLGFVIIP